MEEAVVLGCLRVPCAHELTNSHAVNLKFGPSIVCHLVLQDLSFSRANQECFILNKIQCPEEEVSAVSGNQDPVLPLDLIGIVPGKSQNWLSRWLSSYETLPALPQDPSLVPSTQVVAHNHFNSSSGDRKSSGFSGHQA